MKRCQTSKIHAYHLIVIFVALLLQTSCHSKRPCCFRPSPSYYKVYSGATLPREQVAFLVTQPRSYNWFLLGFPASPRIAIERIDGKDVSGSESDGTIQVELLPGHHVAIVRYSSPNAYSPCDVALKFKADPGHTYLAYAIVIVEGSFWSRVSRWRPEIYDITNKDNRLVISTTQRLIPLY